MSPSTVLKFALTLTLSNLGLCCISAIASANGWPTVLPESHPNQVLLYPHDNPHDDLNNDLSHTTPLISPPSLSVHEAHGRTDTLPTGVIPVYPDHHPTALDQFEAIPIYPNTADSLSNPVAASSPTAAAAFSTPTIHSLQLIGANALTPEIATALFRFQFNRPVSDRLLEQGSLSIDQWYLDQGYSLSRVVGLMIDPSGLLIVEVAEPQVRQIAIRYVDEAGSSVDEDGQPIQGRTTKTFIQKELQVQPGNLFNQNDVIQDIRHLVGLDLFTNANVAVEVDEDPSQEPMVDIIYSLEEKLSRSFQASGGVSTELGLFAGLNYQDRNVRGRGDSIRLGTQVGSRGLVFNTGFTHPYRDSHPNHLGYDINAFRRTGRSLTFSNEVAVSNGDDARERQLGGGVAVMRTLGNWDAEWGVNYTRTSIRDESGDLALQDELGNPLTLSQSGIDDLTTVGFQLAQDQRINPLNPNAGSVLSLSTEQSIPIGNGSILMNRFRANYSEYVPVKLFDRGQIQNPEVFAFNLQAGTILGDLPPYEAFDLGGSHSVRGYGAGDVGSGRHFAAASAEYRFPVLGSVGGVLFTDFASDLGSNREVPGEPASVRNKPGAGFGYGLGFRVGSPLGLIRADFGLNDQGDNQFHFGFGQRF